MTWIIADKTLTNRLFLGTALYPSPEIMTQAIKAAQTQVITVSIKRELSGGTKNTFWQTLKTLNTHLLPNTAGCHTAQDAFTTAQMAREIFDTNWIKLEVIGDDYTLQPDPFELLKATKLCIDAGFEVFPYCTDDLVLCQKLIDVGCTILMPWGAPIGTGLGLTDPHALKTLRARFPHINLIVDAGMGSPSQAAQAMEMGFDGLLLNSAVALSGNPPKMAEGFAQAVSAGRLAFEAGIMEQRESASPSTPILDTPFWHQTSESSTPSNHKEVCDEN